VLITPPSDCFELAEQPNATTNTQAIEMSQCRATASIACLNVSRSRGLHNCGQTQVRTQVEQVLRQIDRMTDEQQCELLEGMLLKQRRSDLGWGTIKRIRATLPRRSEQRVKRDVDVAIQQVRREHSRAART
jgi:hypothetical protein